MNSAQQSSHIEGFANEINHACFTGSILLVSEHAGGKRDDGQVCQTQLAVYASRGLNAIEHRHLHVHQYDVDSRRVSAQVLDRLQPMRCHGNLRTCRQKQAPGHFQIDVAVVHDEHTHAVQRKALRC